MRGQTLGSSADHVRVAFVLIGAGLVQAQAPPSTPPGIVLADLTWPQAEQILTPDTIVVIPLGAEAKEHGPHLRLKNDFVLARVLHAAACIERRTWWSRRRSTTTSIPRSWSTRARRRCASRRRATWSSTSAAASPASGRSGSTCSTPASPRSARSKPAQDLLAADGIVLRYTDILTVGGEAEKAVRQQEGGTHADEIETSMMLYMDPSLVDMSKAAKDYHPQGTGGLTRDPKGKGTYSPTGIWGDATLATREKGRRVVEAMVEGMLKEIEALRGMPVPVR